MKIYLSIIIIGHLFFACNHSAENKSVSFDTLNISEEIEVKETSLDTLYTLLDRALHLDTLEYSNFEPLLFIKTGNFLSLTEKNAVIISCPTDDYTYKIELFSKIAEKWKKKDELELQDVMPVFFDLVFDDYDFDGQKDIYVQGVVSNGYALSRGHLLTINPETKKMKTHPETRDLANMYPDFETKIIFSEDVDWSIDYGFRQVCELKHKWVDGKLKIIKRECPSKKPRGYY